MRDMMWPPTAANKKQMRQTIKINASDNVAVALTTLGAGTRIADGYAEAIKASETPRGHKIALADGELGQAVIKYGFTIGRATQRISSGDWIHTRNLETTLGQNVEYHYRQCDRSGRLSHRTQSKAVGRD